MWHDHPSAQRALDRFATAPVITRTDYREVYALTYDETAEYSDADDLRALWNEALEQAMEANDYAAFGEIATLTPEKVIDQVLAKRTTPYELRVIIVRSVGCNEKVDSCTMTVCPGLTAFVVERREDGRFEAREAA